MNTHEDGCSKSRFILFLLAIILLAATGTAIGSEKSHVNAWWPMLHHDSLSSGYVNSTIPESPEILWSVPLSAGRTFEPVVVDGKVYAVHGRELSCFDSITGDEFWRFDAGYLAYDTPAVADGLVYVGSYAYWGSGMLYCLDSDTGEEVWSIIYGGFLNHYVYNLVIAGDRLLYIHDIWDDAGIQEDHVYYLGVRNKNTGEAFWTRYLYEYHDSQPLFQHLVKYPAMLSSKDIFVVVRGALRKYDASNGYVLWEIDGITESPVIHGNRIIGLDNYSSSIDQAVYCINSDSGQILWTYDAPASGLPAVHDGRVFIGMEDGRFLCLDIETGKEIWTQAFSSVWSSGITVGIGRVLVVARTPPTYEYQLYCLDIDTGDEIWSIPLNGSHAWRRPAAVADGRIYITTGDHTLLCIGEAPVTVNGALDCNPASGTLPFHTNMSLTLRNSYLNQFRRGAVAIDVTLGGGAHFPNWRAGYTNLQPGESRVLLWQMLIPNYPPLVGDNNFHLLVEDVTPAPYNQPPYPQAGDTCTDTVVVTGISP